ncbi:MAG: cytochrome b [Hyphomicrobiaceae bacterium]
MDKRSVDKRAGAPAPATDLVYSPTARKFHWWTVALIAIMIPLGFYMVYRGEATKFDATTGRLYDLHKLIGFTILWLVIARLVYRLRNGAPPDEPTLEWWQKAASHLTHWGLYALLLAIPLLGWIGVSLYGARSIFGVVSLPPLTAVDQDASARVFFFHLWGAVLLCLMIGAHVGAAIFHHVIRKDGVLRRMLPGLKRPS